MKGLVSKLHELEEKLLAVNCNEDNSNPNILLEVINRSIIKEWLKEELHQLEKIIGKKLIHTSEVITVGVSRIRALEETATEVLVPPLQQQIVSEFVNLRCVPFTTLLETFPSYSEILSNQQDKKINPIVIKPSSILVEKDTYLLFTQSLIHLFRNRVIHGIEDPSTRLNSGKAEFANITCQIHEVDGFISLIITDDGQGMSLQSPFDLTQLGLAFSCIKEELEKLEGTCEVTSTMSIGTTFNFTLPYLNKVQL